jgi:subtilisin-like proprotein convertase family protein
MVKRVTHQTSHSIEVLEHRVAPAGIIALAGGGFVNLFTDADNDPANTYETRADSFTPFPGYKGAITVAMGDFDGDGNDELVTARGKLKAAPVRIWDVSGAGKVGVLIDEFVPFPLEKNRGVSVASGDLDGDGKDELIVGAGPGGLASVQIYGDTNSNGRLSDGLVDTFVAFAANFRGGVKVTAGSTDNALGDEVIAGSWSAGGAIAIFKDANNNRSISDDNGGVAFETFAPFGTKFRSGVNVAAGLIENFGGGGADVIVGSGKGKPEVRIFSDTNADGKVGDEAVFDTLLPKGKGLASGAMVAAGDTDESGTFVEVVVGPGAGSGAHVKIFDDTNDMGALLSDNALSFEFDAFARMSGGVNIAFGKARAVTIASPGMPQAIPENGTLTSSFFVPSGAGIIRDLDISLNISHTFDADLDITLTHVGSGISLVLFTDVGGTDEGFIIRLNDEAGTDIEAADNPTDGAITGQFNPEGGALLSVFDGLDLSGEWRLTITDDTAAGADIGTLFSWGLYATL